MTDVVFDPCPEGAEGVIDLGHGVRIRFTQNDVGDRIGLIESHDRPDGEGRCSGAILFDIGPADRYATTASGAERPRWKVSSWKPLTLEPSLLCRTCNHHGFIRNGAWVPA